MENYVNLEKIKTRSECFWLIAVPLAFCWANRNFIKQTVLEDETGKWHVIVLTPAAYGPMNIVAFSTFPCVKPNTKSNSAVISQILICLSFYIQSFVDTASSNFVGRSRLLLGSLGK